MNLEELDANLDTMVAHLELEGETCCLKHSKEDPSENHKAVDYLCQHLGDQKSELAVQGLRIPICEECVKALYDTDWILVYCTYCNKSQWIYRPLAKYKTYPSGNIIYWLDVCPYCAEVVNEYKEEE